MSNGWVALAGRLARAVKDQIAMMSTLGGLCMLNKVNKARGAVSVITELTRDPVIAACSIEIFGQLDCRLWKAEDRFDGTQFDDQCSSQVSLPLIHFRYRVTVM